MISQCDVMHCTSLHLQDIITDSYLVRIAGSVLLTATALLGWATVTVNTDLKKGSSQQGKMRRAKLGENWEKAKYLQYGMLGDDACCALPHVVFSYGPYHSCTKPPNSAEVSMLLWNSKLSV